MIAIPKVFTISLLLLISPLSLWAQEEKVEIERKVEEEVVPEGAREWVGSAYHQLSRLHWYLEESGDGRSYEAKFKHQGQWHSVEFGEDGTLQDVEIIMHGRELPSAVRQPIQTYFDTTFTRYRVRKIQRQLSGPPDALQEAVQDKVSEVVKERYEIEFYGKNEEEDALWEGLFDDQGQLLQLRKVVVRSANNLSY